MHVGAVIEFTEKIQRRKTQTATRGLGSFRERVPLFIHQDRGRWEDPDLVRAFRATHLSGMTDLNGSITQSHVSSVSV